MDHVVFLNKRFKGLQKIIQGEKRAESRWANGKRSPHGRVSKGDRLFFKDTGNPVTVTAEVVDVKNFFKLEREEIQKVIQEYNDTISMTEKEIEFALQKKCGVIIFFDNVKEIEPFNVDKSDFTSMADWIIVDDVNKIRLDA